ncbi:hypothetical protein J1N35_015007, partial [Gossypium stocksii]
SRNGYMPTDIAIGADPKVVHSAKIAWLYSSSDDLTIMLVGGKMKPHTFSYIVCKMCAQNWFTLRAIVIGESFSKGLAPSMVDLNLTIIGSTQFSTPS